MSEIDYLSQDSLLDTKISALNLKLNFSQRELLKLINMRLDGLNIKWRPHTWLSDEWFSPDSIGGFAIPFTVAHPKLIALEKKFLGFYEGESNQNFLKLALHEIGHAIDNAYKLRTLKERQSLFGISKRKYPKQYSPKNVPGRSVDFLGDYYSQSHPEEDWAETVGFFLFYGKLPRSYKNTLAEKKFNYVEKVLSNLQSRPYKIEKKSYLNYKDDKRTVAEYLVEKKKMLKPYKNNFNNKKLDSLFHQKQGKQKANSFVNSYSREFAKRLSYNDPYKRWVLSKFLDDLKDECKRENYNLRYTSNKSLLLIKNHIESNLDDFITQGRTKVFM
jgi:hypothetical protein